VTRAASVISFNQLAGLVTQANKNVLGPQQGTTAATAAVIANIVDFESSLSAAQVTVPGVGRLESGGAQGGPEALHNGIAATLEEVVRHYEAHLGFIFSDEERAALVAFLNAL
jgi:hypothetical protein